MPFGIAEHLSMEDLSEKMLPRGDGMKWEIKQQGRKLVMPLEMPSS